MSNDIHGLKKSVKFSSEPDTGSNSSEKTSNGAIAKLPQKRFYRQRAHSNPLSDHDFAQPHSPKTIDWNQFLGSSVRGKIPEFADIGCGYGGLLIKLSEILPGNCIVGMEIRVKVSDFLQERIMALRDLHPTKYDNICCIRTNAMKYLPNYFTKGQLRAMFFLYPDPHFKKTKHKWRIISPNLLSEYAFFLRPNGIIYTITDVRELHEWILQHFHSHPLYEQLTDLEIKDDPLIPLLHESTEEGQKVTRNSGDKFLAVFRRLGTPPFFRSSE